ncbi:MBL fold metallo-hydrolase [Halocynthiibacter styelae]|uniref:MBL fold metallo-hydrolase n=1 Tax=Halocynthiibacter styelae TaxID=2761955 RepID=A0A8J7IBP2_9RHOB|nr:MBL fold metallo-hydrolase [Paenihalocynthiibacter styelae]MBI1492433.1 MBL fold metallo-hydrolase [Paenihalocynthiibacter styelae]
MNTQPPTAGALTEYEPGVAMVLAPNASPMTYWGTNTWLIGENRLAVLDPGPMDQAHLSALINAIDGRPVDYILVSHAHVDHSPLAHPLATQVGAPVLAFGPATRGQKPHMQALAAIGLAGGGEGIDTGFKPDRTLEDGETILVDGRMLTSLHTPGHMSNHLCFAMEDILFSADHVMGWASSLVSPPDGDLTEFMKSCEKLAARQDRIYYPGHGAPVETPADRIAWLLNHRRSRETQIVAALRDGPASASTLTKRIYTDVNPALLPAAERNVLAHLIDLIQRGQAKPLGDLTAEVKFQLI